MSPNTKKCPNPACGRENSPNENYCIDCGDELDSVSTSPSSAGSVPPTKMEVLTQQMSGPLPPVPPRPPEPAKPGRFKTVVGDFQQDEEIRLVRLGSEGRPQGNPYVFRDRIDFTIGREKGDILIPTDKQVSKTHAKVAIQGAECWVENLSGTNGVFLRLRTNEDYELQDGDELLLATEMLVFHLPVDSAPPVELAADVRPTPLEPGFSPQRDDFVDGGPGPTAQPGSPGRPATAINISGGPAGRRPASSVSIPSPGGGTGGGGGALSGGAGASSQGGLNSRMMPKREFKTEIMGVSDPTPRASVSRCNEGRVTAALFIHLPRVTFGRENCTFNFPGGKISRQHAEIVVKEGKYFLKDLGSQNGTFVRIRGECQLHHEDQFRVGSSCFQFLAPGLGQ